MEKSVGSISSDIWGADDCVVLIATPRFCTNARCRIEYGVAAQSLRYSDSGFLVMGRDI
jgi:hypothetical protein